MRIIILLLKLLSINSLSNQFLHITDIHYDPKYEINGSTKCIGGEIGLGCCRHNELNIYHKASEWGNFNCDTSFKFINETFLWIKNNLKFDFIIYTGDSVEIMVITKDGIQTETFNLKAD